MPVVRFTGLDQEGKLREKGHILWDGSQFRASGPLMQNILALPVVAQKRRLTAQDGEAFLDGLRFQYRSAYLSASAPEESAGAALSIAQGDGRLLHRDLRLRVPTTEPKASP